jgi:aspartate dehydrogenase
LLVEASGLAAVPEIAGAALAEKKDLMIMSVGALIEDLEWFERFRKKNCRLHFPSGAVAGLDALKAAAAGGGLKKVVLTTRKPPAGLAGAPFFKRRKLEPATLTVATKIFSGSARQAIRLFPANVNVAAAVSLAGLGPDRTKVEIIADPAAVRNSHTLSAEGAFGSFRAITENVPSPTNPKTSWLAVLSALALLQTIVRGELRGT